MAGLLRWLRGPQAGWPQDLGAGLALTAVIVPAGVAYAVASGLPAICGLYATLAALLAYAAVGPSRVLVLGPDSALAALLLGVVLPLSGGDPQRAMLLAAAVAVVAGALCVAAGLARLGFVVELLSTPIRCGYLNGIALSLLLSQLAALLALPATPSIWAALRQAAPTAWPLAGALLGLASLAARLLLKRFQPWPTMLVVLVAATTVTALIGDAGHAGIPLLGTLPPGLPRPGWPGLHGSDVLPVLGTGLAVAVVAFADTSVLSRTYAARSGQVVDPNRELVALGVANLAAGLWQGMPVSASASRTPVAQAAGARTQRTGVVAAAVVALLLWLAPGLLAHLPLPALAAVVVASALTLIDAATLRRIRRVQPGEFWLAMACSAGVVVLGPLQGIVLAVLAALLAVLWAAWRPHSAVLGQVPGLAGFHDCARHPEAHTLPGLVLFRWDAPLFFANAEWFQAHALAAVAAAPGPVQRLVITAEPVTSIDITAADMLQALDAQLQAQGITLALAALKGPVKDRLRRHGLLDGWGDERLPRTVDEAVALHRLGAHAAGG
ncbi:MAG: sodium-independent anion transporter [Burkholderiales bacterium PBB5]|nr:MAG: sodium-independent anion transporter [Burkholderiales bacterium PBB5]